MLVHVEQFIYDKLPDVFFSSDNSGTFLVGKGLVKLSGSFKEERLPIL